MTCSDVPTEAKCTQLNGCSWSGACTGDFIPSCSPPSCLYVDNYTTAATTQAGTPTNPVKSISGAITRLANTSGTIIVMNYLDNVTAEVYTNHSITADTTIKPLFNGSFFSLDFNRLYTPTSLTATAVVIKTTKNFTLMGAVVNFTNNYTFVLLDSQNGNVTFNNVHLVDCNSPKVTLYRATSFYSSSIFNFTRGTITNSTLKFMVSGTSYFKNIIIKDLPTISGLITVYGTFNLERIKVTGGQLNASVILFSITQNSNFNMKDSLWKNTNISAMTSTGAKKIYITNTTFRNWYPPQAAPFNLKDVSTDSNSVHTIENCTFKNVTVLTSIFILEKSGITLNLTNTTMDTIIKSSTGSEDPTFASEWVGGVCVATRNDAIVNISTTNFTNIYSHCIAIKASGLNISSSIFNNTALNATQTPLTEDLVNNLVDKSGITWINLEDTTTITNTTNQIELRDNLFINNFLAPKYGGAIRFLGVTAGQIYASGNQFIGNTAYYGGAIYASNVLLGLNLTNNTFLENTAYDGAAIYKKSQEFKRKVFVPSVNLQADNFTKNAAIRNGGAMILDWESLCMDGPVFTQNRAQNGGGIYFITLDKLYNEQYGCIRNTSFIRNSAVDVGGAIKLFFDFEFLREDSLAPTIYTDNTAFKGNDISSEKPAYYRFSFYDVLIEKTFSEFDDLSEWVNNRTRTKFAFSINTSNTTEDLANKRIIQKSGHEVAQIIMLEILNADGSTVDYIRNEQISVSIQAWNNTISDFEPFVAASPVLFTFQNGKIYIKNSLQIMGEPTTTATINFKGIMSSSNLLKDSNLLLDYNITVYFQLCEVGDIWSSITKTCDTCAPGTYSLEDPYSKTAACIQCETSKADCLGGSKIAVLPNFWRFDVETAIILECPADNACLGGLVNETYFDQGICASEYEGNLCSKCIPNFAKFGASDTCMDCRRDGMYYVKFVGFFAIRVIAVVYSVKVNLNKIASKKKARSSNSAELSKKLRTEDFQSNLMKIVVNFLQVSSLIVQYKFEWPDFILEVLDVTNKIVPTEKDGFSVDCIVALITQDNRYLYFINLVVILFQPLGLWLALILGYMLILKIKGEKLKGNSKLAKNIIVLFVISAFVIQPSIVQATLEVFKCQNMRDKVDPAYYMVKDSQVECWTPFHIMWSVGIALPFFLLWGVILPLILLRKLVSTAKNLNNSEVYSRYAFVYEGLKTERYYWEFITLLRKTLIIIIFVFLNMISIQTQAFATFLVILAFGVAHVKYQPYVDRRLNRLEMLSIATLGIMIYSGMFFLSGGSTNFTTVLLIVIALIFNISFYLLTALYFIRSYRHAAKRLTKSVTSKIKGSLDKVKRSRSSSDSSSLSSDKKENENSLVDANNIVEMLSDVNIQLENKGELVSPNHSRSDASQIPSEEEEETNRVHKKKTVFSDRKEEASNYSVMKNSGYYNPALSLHNSGYGLPGLQSGLQSFHNSTVGLLSPAGQNRQFSFLAADRFLRPMNSMEASHPDDHTESPGTPRIKERFRDSPSLKVPQLSPGLRFDDSLMLRHVNSSEPRKSNEEMDDHEHDNDDEK